MTMRPRRWLATRLRQRCGSHWAGLAERAAALSPGRLRLLRAEAQGLRRDLDRFVSRAQTRLDGIARAADVLHLPPGTDWRWRPAVLSSRLERPGIAAPDRGTRLGEETGIWHDCESRALILRQVPNRRAEDLAPYGLRLETMGFRGGYLSVAIDLPQDSLDGLTRSHILRLDSVLSVERPVSIFARLNIGHGPNTDNALRHLGDFHPEEVSARVVEFDLHYLDINERRLERIWLDLIFEAPQMNSIRVRDLFLSRHKRAEV